jgi:hypothetical protein
MLSYVCGNFSFFIGTGAHFIAIPIPLKTSQDNIFFDTQDDLDTYVILQEPDELFWAYLHHKEQYIPVLSLCTQINISLIPSIPEDTIYPKHFISNCESSSNSARSINIIGCRNEDSFYYSKGRELIEFKKTAKPSRQNGESQQDYAVRKFQIVTRDFTAFNNEEW